MDSMYENVIRLSESAIKENEAERLKRKFNFFSSMQNQANSSIMSFPSEKNFKPHLTNTNTISNHSQTHSQSIFTSHDGFNSAKNSYKNFQNPLQIQAQLNSSQLKNKSGFSNNSKEINNLNLSSTGNNIKKLAAGESNSHKRNSSLNRFNQTRLIKGSDSIGSSQIQNISNYNSTSTTYINRNKTPIKISSASSQISLHSKKRYSKNDETLQNRPKTPNSNLKSSNSNFRKNSSQAASAVPVNINNVVNIVNNNYNNIITPPPKAASRNINYQGQIKNVNLYSYGPPSKSEDSEPIPQSYPYPQNHNKVQTPQRNDTGVQNEETERKSEDNTALNSAEPGQRIQNKVLDKAMNNLTNQTEESFEIATYPVKNISVCESSHTNISNNVSLSRQNFDHTGMGMGLNTHHHSQSQKIQLYSHYESLNDRGDKIPNKSKSMRKKLMRSVRSHDIPSEEALERSNERGGMFYQKGITVGRNDQLLDSQFGRIYNHRESNTYDENDGPATDERRDEMNNNYLVNHMTSNLSNDFNTLSAKEYNHHISGNHNNYEYIPYPKKNIFTKNPPCNLSNRFINDESRHQNSFQNNMNYKFIEKIREEKLKQVSFDKKWFWKLNDSAMYNLVSFLSNQYDDLIKSNKSLGTKICLSMNNKFESIVKIFREKYKDVLDLQEYYFKQTNFRKGRSTISVIDLVLKSKIITKLVNQCVEITITYKLGNNEYIQTWKLDIKKKSDIGFWFASEAEEYNKSIIRYCYYQPIVSFCKDDMVEMRINIFSKGGVLDVESFQWYDIIMYATPEHTFLDYEKSLIKSNVKFDRIRYCELENVIHVWKNEKSLTRKQNIEEFKKFFSSHFKILNVDYDFSKFYIFKVKMQAHSIGCVKKNKFTNVDIEIKPYSESLTNETQCLGLLNIVHLEKKVEIRISSSVIFYFTDLYL